MKSMRLAAMRVGAHRLADVFFAPRATELELAVVSMATTARLFLLAGKPAAGGGLVRIDDGRLFLFFDVVDGVLAGAGHAKVIIEAGREMLAAVGEPVWTPCDAAKYPKAPKLVALCGFRPTEEIIEDARVWLKLP